ncbi:MAG: hypothetical protein HXX14_12885 [Bacteroidetes bacterium]|nr:hypothetical protein [Bacteroidota bacterium]
MLSKRLFQKIWTSYLEPPYEVDFIGYLEFNGKLVLNACDFIKLLNLIDSDAKLFHQTLDSLLRSANGNFAFLINNKGSFLLVTDIARNYPLFVIEEKDKFTITDKLGMVDFTTQLNYDSIDQFILSGLVIGDKTIFHNVKAMQAAEILTINNSNITSKRYFKFDYDINLIDKRLNKNIHQEMDKLFLTVFKRMIKSCPNVHNWIIPLSGGHDSRLIVNYLYRLGCKNVICFTYGTANSEQAIISKKVANALGYKWYFIEYTDMAWSELHDSGLFDKYINFSFNGCCLPHIQDLLALYQLIKNNIIGNNDVVVPGHTGITEATHIELKDILTEDNSLFYIYNKYYNFFKHKTVKNKIIETLRTQKQNSQISSSSFPEFYNWQERQAKFINNSVRAYEFFGLSWRLPFWEKDVVDFWQGIDFQKRINRTILFEADKELLLIDILSEIPFVDKYKKETTLVQQISNILPLWLKSRINIILRRKSIQAEGLNNAFALRAKTIKELIGPIELFNKNYHIYFRPYLNRLPFQMNINSLSALYTLRKEVFKSKE